VERRRTIWGKQKLKNPTSNKKLTAKGGESEGGQLGETGKG